MEYSSQANRPSAKQPMEGCKYIKTVIQTDEIKLELRPRDCRNTPGIN